MNCRRCGQPMRNELISCEFCAQEKNDAAVRRLQLEPLLLAAAGRAEFYEHSMASGRHIRMFHSDLAFCGEPVRGKQAKKSKRFFIRYRETRWSELCEKCREKIEELIAEAQEAEAMGQA